ncbi:MAG: sugar kinase [Ktedonobacteraceae bacterium]|nr:sugar kinase [Ktedonobacteraceae bacterium]MBO0795788.1 sugar kinase [Ktedonobacteraceae bacterium]
MANIERIVVVTKKTPLQELVFKQNSKAQARFYLEQNHVSFHEYEVSDFQYQRALEAVRAQLPSHVKQHIIERDFLPTYQFREHDLIVTLGPDGLVMNTAKYLTTQPILALNPDPARIDGVLIPFHYPEAGRHIEQALHGAIQITPISMVKATLNDGQVLYGVNDLFIGIRGHSSARYVLEFAGQREQQSSSGMIVSTGAGSTGWMRSITLGAWHIARSFGQQTSGAPPDEQLQLGWSSSSLWFAVREPFPSKTSQVNLVFGQIPAGQELVITSQMPDNGIIFSDGIESDFLAFNSGFIARIGLAERKAHLITG